MPNALTIDTSPFRALDPSGKLEQEVLKIVNAVSNIARQTNATTQGEMTAPPKISELNVTATSSGFHSIQIVDNEPPQGTVYHIEASSTPNFANPQPVVSNTPYRNSPISHFVGTAGLYYRAYSSFLGGPPSPPVYFGSQAAPTLVQAAGASVTPGPTPLPSTGSGSGTSQLPQGATGFGSSPGSEDFAAPSPINRS